MIDKKSLVIKEHRIAGGSNYTKQERDVWIYGMIFVIDYSGNETNLAWSSWERIKKLMLLYVNFKEIQRI